MNLKVMTWNMSYGYGIGSEGINYVHRDRIHYNLTLSAMNEFIRNNSVDIVLLQEVDFYSHRSHFIDQLDWLSRKTGLMYRSGFVSWNKAYVPYPGLLPKNHFRGVVSGGGILSRFPITPIQNDLLPKPRENLKIYNFFYLNRYLQIVSIQIDKDNPEKKLNFMNLHLEAFSAENRELHLIKVQDRLQDYEIDIAGGDFNGSIELNPPVDLQFEARPAPLPTFPSNQATTVLDGFIFKRGKFKDIQVTTLDSGSVSDHFPVLASFDF